ncbi:MAG: hypothetical protein NZL91_07140 [Thermoflexales bacterium]|nr:hypothetical protein [Thermoflexales bacterium]MDW8394939.1 regulatory iron-sulfur-containing complex subunit RicT [Anaerolineae bacterium]
MSELATKEPSIFDAPEWTGAPSEPPLPPPSAPRLVGVRFQPVGKIYHYLADGFDDLKVGDWVIVDTARGKQMAQVATLKPPKDPQANYKRIERRATGRDMAMRHYYQQKELEAMIACRAESAALKLPIKIVRAEYSFDGQTLTFLFSTDQEERVEVSALREAMSRLYRARIELRQISPREVAKILGGMGACGIEERCCSRFLTEFSPITIKHAKEQNLSLNPQDITGMCGRLRCCLIYEYEQYVEARRHLPKLKSIIGTPMGPGKVVEILHLRDSVKVRFGEGQDAREVVFHREQLVPLEELQRLQEKALSGTCDRHENGECDCGRKSTPQPTDAVAQLSSAAADLTPQAASVPSAESEPAKRKKKRRRKARSATDLGRSDKTKPTPSAQAQPAQPQPAAKKRKPLKKRKKGSGSSGEQ